MKYSSNAVTCIVIAILICLICYEIFFSFRKIGKRLSLRTYLKLQIIKVGVLYFLLDLVVLGHGGWRLSVGNWVQSLIGVFVLSILFGYATPFLISISVSFVSEG